MGFTLWCPRCGYRSSPGEYKPWCPRCNGPLEVDNPPEVARVMGEGGTPLVRLEPWLEAKLEYLNPSGSFKDRGAAYSIAIARDLGFRCVAVDSSGNTGIAAAAYAAYLGLEARVYVPKSAAPGKKALIRALGAMLVEAPSRSEAARLAAGTSERCFHIAHPTNPLFIEGVKSLGRELAPHAEGADILVPTSSGTLLLGIHRGLSEAGVSGYRLIAVQSPRAYSLEGLVKELARIGGPQGEMLDALVMASPPRLGQIVDAISETGGGVVVAGDEAAVEGLLKAHRRGLLAEPSSAAALQAAQHLYESGLLRDRAIVVLTGSSLKYTGLLEGLVR